jgi:imidazolonepropionase-like amidohydrolase
MTNSDILFENANVFDGHSSELREAVSVRVVGDRIREITTSRPLARDTQVIDLKGACLMPGLIDAHFHAYSAEVNTPHLETLPLTYLAHHARQLLNAALLRGFTTVRDAGGADYGLWRAVEEGLIEGPRIFYSGRALSQTGGHGDTRAQHAEPCGCRHVANLSEVVDGVDAVRAAARESLRRGAHQIKIFVSGGISSLTDPVWMLQFSEAEIRVAVEEATSRRTYVMAHAYTGESIRRAVTCGVRSIEHGNLLTEDAAKAMAEHDAILVPTLVTYDALTRWGADQGLALSSQEKLKVVAEDGANAIVKARNAGVRIGFGTDLLGPLHAHQLHEFRLRAAVETPLQTLRSATSVNAALLGKADELGRIGEGALADIIVVDGNPLNGTALFWREPSGVKLVMKGGRIYRNSLDS